PIWFASSTRMLLLRFLKVHLKRVMGTVQADFSRKPPIDQKEVKVAILGTGAMGTYFAAKLYPVADKVTLFGNWKKQKEVIRKKGLVVWDTEGKSETIPLQVLELEKAKSEYDLVLVLVKSWQTERAALSAKQLVNTSNANSRVLSLQNGMGNLEILSEVIGAEWCS